ncbi:PREDICTED: uncharacterized protein LOC107189226 [Dufourea novaeangliae]|uniref:uncharacterized protein LOC107189226 n=1 Tax=Dufourea novaeangliae TaxID=178035 RepID=UPI000767B2EE|nr:PREDICTED: uncharacterized protein LOC107189226 [Dufourea novaeangliae]
MEYQHCFTNMSLESNTEKASIEENICNDEIVDAGTNENIDMEIKVEYQHCSASMSLENNTEKASIEANICNDEIVDAGTNENIDTEIKVKYQHRSTSMSPERIFNSPTKVRLRKVHRKEIKKLKNQLYVNSCKLKRARERVKSLQTVLKDLQKQNLILQENDVLKYLDEGRRELIKCEIRKKKKLPVSRKYKAALRQFALSLHFYSPKAYYYMRHKFHNSLPHPKTISRWYQ